MPIDIIIDKTHRLATTRWSGRVTAQELIGAAQLYEEHLEIQEFRRVWDVSRLDAVEVSQEVLVALL